MKMSIFALFFRFSCLFYLFVFAHHSWGQDCSGKRYKDAVFPSTVAHLDVLYGSNFDQYGATKIDLHVDIYTPPTTDTDTDRPLFILAHGGFFSMGTKNDLAGLAKEAAKMGYVVASMQYRLLDMTDPEVTLNPPLAFHKEVIRAIHDVRALVRFFRKSVAEQNNPYGINPDMIIIGGYSAGGIMANYATYLDKETEIPNNLKSYVEAQGGLEGNSGNPGYSSKIQVAVSLCGAIGDTAWISKNDAPFIGLHNSNDPVVPNVSGYPLTAVGVPLMLTIYGASAIYTRTQNLGIPSAYKSEIALNPATGYHCDFSQNGSKFVTDALHTILCEKNNKQNAIEEQTTINFSLYPNPSNEIFYIDIPNTEMRWNISVFNNLGQLIFDTQIQKNAPQYVFNASDFSKGVYSVLLRSDKGHVGVKKMVIR